MKRIGTQKQWLCRLLGLFVLVLGACGEGASAMTPEAVHAAWVAALRANDRTAALALIAEQPEKESVVDTSLQTMRAKLDSQSPTGALQSVEVRAPVDDGGDKAGISVWRFANRSECWRTTLTAQNGAWKVLRWGQVAPCS